MEPTEPTEPTPCTVAGTMTRQQVADYLRGLRLYLAREGTTLQQKQQIEAEIATWQNALAIAKKITHY